MEEFDTNGWAHIHHAAANGYHKSVVRFVKGAEDQLELLTQDGKQMTSLLLACSSGELETVRILVELGANLKATNSDMFGVVELAALAGHVHILEFLLTLNKPEVDVWSSLNKTLTGSKGPDLQVAGIKSLADLTVKEKPANFEPFLNSAGIENVVKLLRNELTGTDGKIHSLTTLSNLVFNHQPSKPKMVMCNGLQALTAQLQNAEREIYLQALKLLGEMAYDQSNKEVIFNAGGVTSAVKFLDKDDDEVVLSCVNTLKVLSENNQEVQSAICTQKTPVSSLVAILRDNKNKHVLAAAARLVRALVYTHKGNQDQFTEEGVIPHLLEQFKLRYYECHYATVNAIYALAEGNEGNQTLLTEHGCVMVLMRLLKRSRSPDLRALTGGAIWAIAGNKSAQRRYVAAEIGVNLLIEFLSENLPSELHYIGAEGLGVLAEGIQNKRDEIAKANGVMPLVRLLGNISTPEHIHLSVLKTIRLLCVSLGYRPHTDNQASVNSEGGIKSIMRILLHSRQQQLQVEAAYTMACVCMCNPDNQTVVSKYVGFSYIHILRLLYANDPHIQLIAGAALAIFAFNNVENQQEIAKAGGIRFHSFVGFLESSNEFEVVHAAFQVVVLSRIIPDNDQALTSATGIKLLVDHLQSKDESIQALAANFIAGLAHTRAGVPQAIVSINTIDLLAKLLLSPSEIVQASASVALGYLSYDNLGGRLLLKVCRHDPFLFNVVHFHTGKIKLSSKFVDRWKHVKTLGLPPITKRPGHIIGPEKKLIQHPSFNTEPTFTMASMSESRIGTGEDTSLQERRPSASTVIKLPGN